MDQKIQLIIGAAFLSIALAFIITPVQNAFQLPDEIFRTLAQALILLTFVTSGLAGLLLIIDTFKKE